MWNKKRAITQKGLTLIEVLIALVISAIALTALIKATAENIRATTYLQEKTIATWVGLRVLNQARLQLFLFPESPDYREQKEIMLNQNWQWQGFTKPTANKRIREIQVKVFHQPEHRLITELRSYVYAD